MEVEEVLAATIEPPPSTSVNNAVLALRQIGALNEKKKLTSLGRVLLQLPVEAALGKLVLYGAFYRCLDSALTLAAILADRDPFLAPQANMERANEVKDSWSPPGFRSDPLAVVSVYNTWYTLQQSGRHREARDFISFNFIHASTFMSIHKVKEQIYTALVDAGVIAISAGGIQIGRGPGSRFLNSMPASLNSNSDSLPLLAALIATSAAPNFAIRVDEKSYRTNMDRVRSLSLLLDRFRDASSFSPFLLSLFCLVFLFFEFADLLPFLFLLLFFHSHRSAKSTSLRSTTSGERTSKPNRLPSSLRRLSTRSPRRSDSPRTNRFSFERRLDWIR